MCGRINVSDHPGVQILMDYLDLPIYPDNFTPRFNIAPGATLYAAFVNNNTPETAQMQWGIIPAWAKPDKFDKPLINARAETVWDKPSFRNLIKSQRVIIPINGFYEWRREDKQKTPFYIHAKQQNAMALAGLYQISKQGELECCVVTTSANQFMNKVHHRMPVILTPEAMKDWLLSKDQSCLNALMNPCDENFLQLNQVSAYVNNAANEGEKCVETINDVEETPANLQHGLEFK